MASITAIIGRRMVRTVGELTSNGWVLNRYPLE